MLKFVNIQELVGAFSLGSTVNIAGSQSRTKFHVPQPLGRPCMLSAIEVKVCVSLLDFSLIKWYTVSP